jgi:hypothetical protein
MDFLGSSEAFEGRRGVLDVDNTNRTYYYTV